MREEKVEARVREEGGSKPYASRRSRGEVDRHENALICALVRIADDQNRSVASLQQARDDGGSERLGEGGPSMTTGHDKVDVVRLRARRDCAGHISNADIGAV